MKRSKNFLLLCSLLLMFASMTGMLIGCGGSGGGGGDTNNPNPDQTLTGSLQFSKLAYNFGNVTLGNTATLSVIISNTGTRNISISELTLSDNTNFSIDASECGSGPYTIATGSSCTVTATFAPTVEGSYSETLNITSDDADTPNVAATLTGEGKTISAYTVTLNQVETDCPTSTVTAYVSVTDQEGFAVTDLTIGDFTIKEEDGGAPIVPASVDFAHSTSFPLSVAVLMDYSGSVYEVTNLAETIENSVFNFVGGLDLGVGDQAEIIKFATLVQRIQGFTNDGVDLEAAIYEVPVGVGEYTALYDAIYMGIDDAAQTTTSRRAVLVLTDGQNYNPAGGYYLQNVINLGKDMGVPVFTVGVGENVNANVLLQIASETGGQYFDSPDMDRLRTIYSQLSSILNNQFILTYTSAGSGDYVQVSLQYDTANGGSTSSSSNKLTYSCP